MSKKILGLVVSVALLMVVLSGCFLLPQIDTFTPLVTIVSPAPSQTITVPTSTSSTNVTVTATVLAHSPIQSVQISLVQNGQNYGSFNMSGAFGQNTGSFSYTFTNLPVGSYYLTVTAQSQAKTPGSASQKFSIVSAQPVTPPSTKYAAPVVSLINVAPNYQGKYYVAKAPITFSATVTNPNKVGQLAVWASVNGQTIQPNNNSNPYTFTWTPSATGTYTLYVNATVTIGASTVSGSNSVVIKVPFINPSANVTGIPSRLVMASTTPASFTFTTTSGVNAYLSINGGAAATYTSQSPIANSKLLPNQWNTLTLTFKDPWGYTIQTAVATVLGVQTSNTSQTPYIFLIDKSGHVVSNTNDWINITAGASIDLYGYIQAPQGQTINNYNITEQYFSNKETTSNLTSETSIESANSLNSNVVPLKLLAYLFNTSTTSPEFVQFTGYINTQQVKAFLRYQVQAETTGPSVSLSVANTYEGVPAAITVTANSANLQPLTGLVFSVPVNVTPASSWNGYSKPAMTAFGSTTSVTMSNKVSYTYNLIASVSTVEASGVNAYGFVTGSKTYYVALYGPSGTYSLGATVTNIANAISTPSATYLIQADTSAPVANVTLSGSYVTINGMKVYYAPNLKATFNLNDDHAIYWAKLSFATNLQVYYPNNTQINNYGVTATTVTVSVPFNKGIGTYTFYPIASDKHFDSETYMSNLATTTAIGTGNRLSHSGTMTVYYDNGSNLKVTGIDSYYNTVATSIRQDFVVYATDNGGIGFAGTAVTVLTPVGSTTPVATFNSPLTAGATSGSYIVTVNYINLPSGQYTVKIGIPDQIYFALPVTSTARASHIAYVNWQTPVNIERLNLSLYAINNYGTANQTLVPVSATTTTNLINTTVYRLYISGANVNNFDWAYLSQNSSAGLNQLVKFYSGPVGGAIANRNDLVLLNLNTNKDYVDFYLPGGLYSNGTLGPQQILIWVYPSSQPNSAYNGLFSAVVNPTQPPVTATFANTQGFGSASTPVVVNGTSYTAKVNITPNQTLGYGNDVLTVSLNNTPLVTLSPAPNQATTVTVQIPLVEGMNSDQLNVRYAPNWSPAVQSLGAKVLSADNIVKLLGSTLMSTANIYYATGTNIYILRDTATPTVKFSVQNNSLASTNVTVTISGVGFYYHNIAPETWAKINSTQTQPNGNTISTSYSINYGQPLTSQFTQQGTNSVVFTYPLNGAGSYNLTVNAYDPYTGKSTSANVNFSYGVGGPSVKSVNLSNSVTSTPVNSSLQVISGIVQPISVVTSNSNLVVKASDNVGIKSITVTLTNLLDNSVLPVTKTIYATNNVNNFTVSGTLTNLANILNHLSSAKPEYTAIPYSISVTVNDFANQSSTWNGILAYNYDGHQSASIVNISVLSSNQIQITLSQPVWAANFKYLSVQYKSSTMAASQTLTSVSIQPVNTLYTYNGQSIATQFNVTFNTNLLSTNSGSNNFSNWILLTNNQTQNSLTDLVGAWFVTPPVSITLSGLQVGKGTVKPGATITATVTALFPSNSVSPVVTFNGVSAVNTTGNTWAAKLTAPTSTGWFPITVQASNAAGNFASEATKVYVDASAPTITVKLNGNEYLQGGLQPSLTAGNTYTVFSQTGSGTLTYTVYTSSQHAGASNYATQTVLATVNNTTYVLKHDTLGSTTNSISNLTNTATISLFATNSLNGLSAKFAKTTVKFVTDNFRPIISSISWTPSASPAQTLSPITITVVATDATNVFVNNAVQHIVGVGVKSVRINGYLATQVGPNTFAYATTVANQPQWKLTVTVKDFLGNSTTKYATVVTQSNYSAPTITVTLLNNHGTPTPITNGSNGSLLYAQPGAYIEYTVSGPAYVKASLNGKTFTSTQASVVLNNSYANGFPISVVATNIYNSSKAASFNANPNIIVSNQKPTVSIATPTSVLNGATFVATVTVSHNPNVPLNRVEINNYIPTLIPALSTNSTSVYTYTFTASNYPSTSMTLKATAIDMAGNVGTATTIVKLNPTTLNISNFSTSTTDTVTTTNGKQIGSGAPLTVSFEVSGNASLTSAEITLSNQSTTVNLNQNQSKNNQTYVAIFTVAQLQSLNGSNIPGTISVTDQTGHSVTYAFEIGIWGQAPTVTVQIGSNTLNTGSNNLLYFKTAPTATITIKGYKLDLLSNGSTASTYAYDSRHATSLIFTKTSGASQATFKATYTGNYSITVKATDGVSGKSTSQTYQVTIGFGSVPPTVQATLQTWQATIPYKTSPTAKATEDHYINHNTTSYNATIIVKDPNLIPLSSVTMYLNGVPTSLPLTNGNANGISAQVSSASTAATYNINLVSLMQGKQTGYYTLTVSAQDKVGNSELTAAATSFYYDVTQPTVSGYISTASGSPVYLVFSEPMATSTHKTFTATLTNVNTSQEYVGDFTFINSTQATATTFNLIGYGTVTNSNSNYISSGTYNLTLPSTVTDLASNTVSTKSITINVN